MKLLRSLCCGALCAALLLPAGAMAAQYSDLPSSHWAYADMDQAAALGIINGMGDGRMAPEDTLTWGQYLTMLTRTFCPEAYAALTEAGAAWDQAGYWAAKDSGLLPAEEFLPVDETRLNEPILRQDAAVLLDRVLPENTSSRWWWQDDPMTAQEAFSDWDALGEAWQDSLSRLYVAGVVQGREDGTFGGGETIKRADGTVLLIRVLDQVDMALHGEEKTVTLHIVDPSGEPLCDDQTVETKVGAYLPYLADTNALWHYTLMDERLSIYDVSSVCDTYTLTFRPFTRLEAAQADFQEAVERGELSWDDYATQDFWLWELGENARKSLLLYGNEYQLRFNDRQEAEAGMATVTVPVWRINKKGEKVGTKVSLTVHAALAEDVTAIFTEIYNDPEQFPIREMGGYGWRGDSSNSEHNCGTAIDINWNENYQIREGVIQTGSLWAPGENPYSIAPGSSVVRIFAEHGWAWGGDAWAGYSDDSTGYHDYMHFSYLGR